ncbi:MULTISPECIES: tRNA dihydrouridine synthase [Acinetobacter]|uniref:tRNA-dihydrouridine(16) synthase n=1 Tax=Acinetobacter baylyi (strain ATCC 33305 / BD413 / ADP1) TaxID=62977 RepID=Q6FDX0_ACIAD|nr:MULTISPECIES: tRNA-dihydrouridine synthase [Acinetobacter]KAF2371416.1 tRNA-dihydrouridine synthase C [Acinetobacter baylyi]KAF2373556.1 tRNA-dihydrouridine synthase C [Acinetobacter baylyi]KAF2376596.1 tRNA-dihydrouridine synthase C [Acinetobacter baylyi]KAF2381347.1 tRNA-dihydrouridine synthase C [Acinetobacter baylyi]KAF2384814.1 tRNA-dihydrouridine synthase C [Acinetobacter baylyi]
MKLILAPMEGLTDPIMRDVLTHVGSFDWCVTEFIRVTDSVLPDHVYYTYCPELKNNGKTAAGTPVHVQFLGNNPDMLAANAEKVVALGAPAIDLNFGCPAKTVNRHRGGSILLDEPDVVHLLVKAVRDAVPAHIPVSAKMRLGYLDENHTMDNAYAIQEAGANWLTVHARTKADGYTPPAYWEKIQPIKDALSINVIANGEIWTNQDAKACQQQSGCEDLMIGRGAVTTPDLTLCIRQNVDEALMNWAALIELQQRFLNGEYKTEIGMIGRYKQWLGMMTKAYPEAKQLWDEIKRIKNLDEILLKLGRSS